MDAEYRSQRLREMADAVAVLDPTKIDRVAMLKSWNECVARDHADFEKMKAEEIPLREDLQRQFTV